jgi:predicted  nucleic acid-binding Zn-ribbon protein
LADGYELKIRDLEEKLAAEIRKMEDSNGYLKKMYEEKINNYEKEISELKSKLASSQNTIASLESKIQKLESEL